MGGRFDRFQFHHQKGHVESFFVRATDPHADRAIWIKATALVHLDGRRFADAWVVAFRRGLPPVANKLRVPLDQAFFSRASIDARIGPCVLSTREVRGSFQGDPDFEYELTIQGGGGPIYWLPQAFYFAPIAGNKTTTPLPDMMISGVFRFRDETWTVDRWRGSLGHNWGHAHTASYCWALCNTWDQTDQDVFLELGLGWPRVLGVTVPIRLLALRIRGERYDMTSAKHMLTNRCTRSLRGCTFQGRDRRLRVRGEISAELEDFAGLRYEEPNGDTLECLNSNLALAKFDISFFDDRPPLALTSRHAALEIGTRDRDHGVAMIS